MGKEEKTEGLTIADLMGKIVKARVTGKPIPSVAGNGEPTLTIPVEYDGKSYQVGAIRKDAIESLLKHGEKVKINDEITVYLNVPEDKLSAPSEKLNWINMPY